MKIELHTTTTAAITWNDENGEGCFATIYIADDVSSYEDRDLYATEGEAEAACREDYFAQMKELGLTDDEAKEATDTIMIAASSMLNDWFSAHN